VAYACDDKPLQKLLAASHWWRKTVELLDIYPATDKKQYELVDLENNGSMTAGLFRSS